MKLYYAPRTISVAAVMMLDETGIEHELVALDFGAGEQTGAAYHAINPKGRVPALDTGDGVLTETGAILEFVAAQVPERSLVPGDPMQAARMREAMYYLASTMHVNHAHKMRGHRWADREESRRDMTNKVVQTMTDSARYVEERMLRGPLILGEALSVADFYLYTVCSWLEGDGVDVEALPRIRAFRTEMEGRASVRHAHENGLFG
ncbi:glutathione S-transferase family protein [Roseovarius sp. SCSIO 43702]|uniref:glutathione S-transferase family protein n=1 Tax=Roseovarius sp. SCSIO 43702 TaxID=2823043 RepID=UPI001C72EE30|nr:glutathione S-transferase family protein [Roseovarius sp. SCSIO 43702]QYX58475.1 glutathione S-transferase family protein [Roseovarius sp. SCSIO 43702]